MLRSDNKIGLKMDLNPIFLAKRKRIIIHFESIIMDFIISRKSHKNGFFFTSFLFRELCKILQEFQHLSSQ